MKIVAVTSCATGIAHSYMAAESLRKAAKEIGDEIKVEVQGAMGIENRLSEEDIEGAELIIFAVDVNVRDRNRFNNKKIFEIGPNEVIHDGKKALLKIKEEAK